jgi:hypothetical protein
VVPTTSPPTATSQEPSALKSAATTTSPEIQEIEEGLGGAQLREPEDGDAWILDLTHFSWTAAFEAGDDAEGGEESAACNTLERGLSWVCHAFDELILPAMTVSSIDEVTHLYFLLFFRYVWLMSSSFGADTRGVWSEKSACGQRAPCGENPARDVAGGCSGGRSCGGGKRGDDEDDARDRQVVCER